MGDYRTTTGEAAPIAPRERKRRLHRNLAIGGCLLLVLLVLGFVIHVDRTVLATGYVASENYAEVRPSVEGVVAEILVGSGASIETGALLARLDDSEQSAHVEEARHRYRKLETDIQRRETELTENLRALEHEIGIARLREKNAASKLSRARDLQARGLSSAASVEEFALQQEVAAAELAARQERDPSLPARELEGLRFELDALSDAITRAEAQRLRREIRSPLSGQVVRYEFTKGEFVRPDTVLYEIFGGARQILKLRISERYATRIVPGQSYRARLAPYRGLFSTRFRGKIEFIRDIIQDEGGRTYRTVYGSFDAGDRPVPPGTTAEAKISTCRLCLWKYLFGLD